jgi:hypothetical protein
MAELKTKISDKVLQKLWMFQLRITDRVDGDTVCVQKFTIYLISAVHDHLKCFSSAKG